MRILQERVATKTDHSCLQWKRELNYFVHLSLINLNNECIATVSIFSLTIDHLYHFFIVLDFELEMKMRRPTKSMKLIPTTMMMVNTETLRNVMGNSDMISSTVAFA